MGEEPQVLKPLQQWYLAFVPGEEIWWHRFLPGYGHVFAFTYDPRVKTWLVYDMTMTGMFVRGATEDEIDMAITAVAEVGEILKVDVEPVARIPRPYLFATCVTAIGIDGS